MRRRLLTGVPVAGPVTAHVLLSALHQLLFKSISITKYKLKCKISANKEKSSVENVVSINHN